MAIEAQSKIPLKDFLKFESRAGQRVKTSTIYSYFEKGCRKEKHQSVPKGNLQVCFFFARGKFVFPLRGLYL